MARGKRTSLILVILLLLSSTSAYADTTADLFRLYGISDPPKVEEEVVVLDELLDDLFATKSKLNSYKMMDTASALFEIQYMELMQKMDVNILTLDAELKTAEENLKKSGSLSIEGILKADIHYRKVKSEYDAAIDDRVLAVEQLTNVRYENPEKTVTETQVASLEKEVAQQKAVVEKAKSFLEIGDVGGNKYPLSSKTKITSPFGWRLDPMDKVNMQYHQGLDFTAAMRTPVLAQFGGIVEAVKETTTGGKTVVVNHGNNVRTVYIHLDSYKVKVGDKVKQYQTLALSGNTGSRTTGPHLHFGLFIGGKAYDPSRLYR